MSCVGSFEIVFISVEDYRLSSVAIATFAVVTVTHVQVIVTLRVNGGEPYLQAAAAYSKNSSEFTFHLRVNTWGQ